MIPHTQMSEKECVIDLDEEWMRKLKANYCIKHEKKEEARSIDSRTSRVPPRFYDVEPKAYAPRVISIGPYHHRNQQLCITNSIKSVFVQQLLELNSHVHLEDYVKTIKRLEQQARDSYSEIVDMSSNDFCEMLLVDCAFLIIFVHQYWESNDLMSSLMKTHAFIGTDLLLVENQLPFLVLESLYNLAIPTGIGSLAVIVHATFRAVPTEGLIYIPNKSQQLLVKYHNILEAVHSAVSHSEEPRHNKSRCAKIISKAKELLACSGSRTSIDEDKLKTFASATQLYKSGIEFKGRKPCYGHSGFIVRFCKGTIKIPMFILNENSSRLFLNLVAFEQSFPVTTKTFGAYAWFMGLLIQTADDMSLLQHSGIIVNYLGSDDDAASFFIKLKKNVEYDPDYDHFFAIYEDVKRHTNSKWNRNFTLLRRKYFRSPWTAISFVAAILVVLLTAVQTVFAILSYVKPPM